MRTSPVFIAILTASFLFAPAGADEYTATLTFDPGDLAFYDLEGFQAPVLKGCTSGNKAGEPILPWRPVNVALPPGAAYKGFEIKNALWLELEGRYMIAPLPEARRLSDGPPDGPIFLPDPKIYNRSTSFPENPVRSLESFDLYGQGFAAFSICPLQYDPEAESLRFLTSLTFDVFYERGLPDPMETYNLSDYGEQVVRRMMHRLALNPEGVSPCLGRTTNRALEPGQYDIVVITNDDYMSDWDAYKFWRDKKGTPCKVVSKQWIQANYPGADVPAQIRNFIKDANPSWGALFFLMGGDTYWVPCHFKTISGTNIANDCYYSDFDDDWKCEVFVGRASVQNSTQIQTFTNKVLAYEKDPALSGFGRSAFFYAFDLDTWTKSHWMKDYIDSNHLPGSFSLNTEYDNESGAHKEDSRAYMNAGPNLINHSDHANTSVMGVGSVNHDDHFNGFDVSNFTNGMNRLGNQYSLGCHAGHYDYNDCIGEMYVNDADGGGVSFVGNSRNGWYTPFWPYSLSGAYDIRYFEALFDKDAYLIGDTLATSKNIASPGGDTEKYIHTELTLLGDPAMPLWTSDISPLSVQCDGEIDPGLQNYSVTVKTGTSPVSGSLVCLFKEGEVYETGYTSGAGVANFTIEPLTPGTLYVTATKRNCRPAEADATVEGATQPPVLSSVSPASGSFVGGTPVTLLGDNFKVDGNADVTFGGLDAQSIVVVDNSTITCQTPAAPIPGFVDVTVTTILGSDTLQDAYEYRPIAGAAPLNITDVDTGNLNPPQAVTLSITGNASSPYILFFSAGGGPISTIWGTMGLDIPVMAIVSAVIPGSGYQNFTFQIEDIGPLTFYLQALVDHTGGPVWAVGGNNPNGSGSVMFVLP